MEKNYSEFIDFYGTKEVTFNFRGRSYCFALSQELFSSADIDAGSRFLLKVFSDFLDKAEQIPCSILDSGCGTGVLGICAAGALAALRPPEDSTPGMAFHVRAQDRDELARRFTEFNARRNGLSEEVLSAYTEPLLAGPEGRGWDLILTNIPAKAGLPVLEDFISRSAGLLTKNGRVFLVAVNTLADFFRTRIAAVGAPLIAEETGKEHTVFVYGKADSPAEQQSGPIVFDENFPHSCPFYIRNRSEYEMEGLPYSLDTVHGAPDFDNPGGAVQAAAKLAVKIDLASKMKSSSAGGNTGQKALLIHDAGQGHFALWLARYLNGDYKWVLSGRNIVALGAASAALRTVIGRKGSITMPAVDIFLDRERLGAAGAGGRFGLIAFFPETMPDIEAAWEGITALAAPEGLIITGMSSVEAERFDRKKPAEWCRMGDIKRKGFRALAYQTN